LTACGKKKAETPPPLTPLPSGAATMPDPAATALTVDGFVIKWGDIFAEIQRLQQASRQPVTPQQAADGLVVRRLLDLAADKELIVIQAADIATAIKTVRQQIPTNTTLEAMLRGNKITEDQFRSNIITTLKVERLLQQIIQKVPAATDADLKQFLKDNPDFLKVPENVTARTLLVAVRPADDAAARKTKKAKAEGLRKQLLGGANFGTLAATESDDPTRANGGQLPPLRRGQVTDKVFEEAAFSQKEGDIGPVIETQYGYVIIQVQKHVKASTLKFEDVKERLRTLVTDSKRQRAMQEYIAGLRAKAKIVLPNTPPAK
jgi:peptidyl-prolyl cis-trans isomerase C